MAKGQKRSTKEIRKPKAEKPKPPVAVSRFTTEFSKKDGSGGLGSKKS